MAGFRNSWHKPLLTLHVMTTVSVLGADLTLLTLGFASLLGENPASVYPAAHLIASRVVQPLAILALATGVALGLLTPYGLIQYWWTAIKLGITAGLSVVVVAVLVPQLGARAEAATAAAPRVFTAAERLPAAVAPVVASTLLVVNVALGIYKPRWRLRRSTRASYTSPEYA